MLKFCTYLICAGLVLVVGNIDDTQPMNYGEASGYILIIVAVLLGLNDTKPGKWPTKGQSK